MKYMHMHNQFTTWMQDSPHPGLREAIISCHRLTSHITLTKELCLVGAEMFTLFDMMYKPECCKQILIKCDEEKHFQFTF